MYGYTNPQLAEQLVHDRRERLQRDAGRSRLFRESRRLRTHQRNS